MSHVGGAMLVSRGTSTIRPTRNKEIHNEQDNQSRQCEGT